MAQKKSRFNEEFKKAIDHPYYRFFIVTILCSFVFFILPILIKDDRQAVSIGFLFLLFIVLIPILIALRCILNESTKAVSHFSKFLFVLVIAAVLYALYLFIRPLFGFLEFAQRELFILYAFVIFIILCSLFVAKRRTLFIIAAWFFICILIIQSLRISYFPNILSKPINKIATMISNKSLVDEIYYHETGSLGFYSMNATAKIVYTNGEVYEGQLYAKHDLITPQINKVEGKYILANGDIYEGHFDDNKRNGRGKLTFADGRTYEGDFRDDKMNGKGKLTVISGYIFEGAFLDDNMIGYILHTHPDGSVTLEEWADGKHIRTVEQISP